MKRANNLIEQIIDPDNLREAFYKAQKGKSYAHAVQSYRNNLDEELLSLRAEIGEGKVKVGHYRFFKIYEPKEREIYIKEELRCRAYVRYMDDFILWHDDKTSLKQMQRAIEIYLENELRLKLNPVLLNKTRCGLPFLGYLIFPHYVRLAQKSKHRFIKKMRIIEERYKTGVWTEEYCQRKVLPLLAFTQHADTKKFRKNVLLDLSMRSK